MAASRTSVSLQSDMISLASDRIPSIAAQVVPLTSFPSVPNACSLDVILGLRQVLLEGALQLGITGLLDHGGQVLRDLVLGVVDVLHGVDKQVIQRLDR